MKGEPMKEEIKRIILETFALEQIDPDHLPPNCEWVIYKPGCFKINIDKTIDNLYNWMRGVKL